MSLKKNEEFVQVIPQGVIERIKNSIEIKEFSFYLVIEYDSQIPFNKEKGEWFKIKIFDKQTSKLIIERNLPYCRFTQEKMVAFMKLRDLIDEMYDEIANMNIPFVNEKTNGKYVLLNHAESVFIKGK